MRAEVQNETDDLAKDSIRNQTGPVDALLGVEHRTVNRGSVESLPRAVSGVMRVGRRQGKLKTWPRKGSEWRSGR